MCQEPRTGGPDPPFSDLRKRAEEKVRAGEAKTQESPLPDETGQVLHELRVHQIELEMQNEELRRAHAELEASRARYFDLYDLAPVGYFTISKKGLILEANLTAAGLLGVTRNALVKRPLIQFIIEEDRDLFYRIFKQLFETGAPQTFDFRMLRANAAPFWARIKATAVQDADGAPVSRVVISDNTETKQAERHQHLSVEVMGILNEPLGLADMITSILAAIKRETGFDAVGIRLRSDEDFPYFVQNGFSGDFMLEENTLVVRAQDGGVCRDANGNVRLECTCGLVLSGQTDPAHPFFTPGGSFWTNNALPLLDLPAAQDPRLHPRNRCIHDGFRSVALIPIRAHQEIVGLLQLNSRREDCFTFDIVQFFEETGASIGVALMQQQAEAALRDSEDRFRAIASNMPDHILVQDHELRYLFVVNPQMGLTEQDMIGKTDYDFLTREDADKLTAVKRQVLATGNPIYLEAPLISARGEQEIFEGSYVPKHDAQGQVDGLIGYFRNVTAHRRIEDELRKTNRTLAAHSQSDRAMMRATDESEYVREVCKILVKTCGHAMVWIGFAEEDAGKTVRPVVSAGFEEGYLETLKITWADTERGRGPTGTAIRTGKPSSCRNMLTDPKFSPWREEALKRGYTSSLVLPLMGESRAFGAITIYAREPEAFSDDEVKLLSELADDLAFGIAAIRLRAAHAQAEDSLRRSEEHFRTLFNGMTEGFALHEIVTDENGEPCDYRFIEVNPAFERLTGLKRDDIVGRSMWEVLPNNEQCWVETYGKVALTGEPIHFEDYSTPLNKWFEVFSYRPAPRQFAVIFMDVTGRKLAEADIRRHVEELRAINEELGRFNRVAVDRELRMVELKKQVNELCIQAGQTPPYPLDFDKNG